MLIYLFIYLFIFFLPVSNDSLELELQCLLHIENNSHAWNFLAFPIIYLQCGIPDSNIVSKMIGAISCCDS